MRLTKDSLQYCREIKEYNNPIAYPFINYLPETDLSIEFIEADIAIKQLNISQFATTLNVFRATNDQFEVPSLITPNDNDNNNYYSVSKESFQSINFY